MVHNHDNQSISSSCLEEQMMKDDKFNPANEALSTVSSRGNKYNEGLDLVQEVLVEVNKESEHSSIQHGFLETESKISENKKSGDTFRSVINQCRVSNLLPNYLAFLLHY